jgi:hypothetical protein
MVVSSTETNKPTASQIKEIANRWNKTLKAIHPTAHVKVEDVKAYFDRRFNGKS